MKTNILITIGVLFVTGVLLLLGVRLLRESEKGSEGTVFIDNTDGYLPFVDSNEILSISNIERNQSWKHSLNIQNITGYEYNAVNTISIENEFLPLGSPSLREQEIEQFKNKVSRKIEEMNKPAKLNHSSIYVPIVREANRLSSSHANKKYIIVYSNLLENDNFSIYLKSNYSELYKHPEQIQKKLTDLLMPKDLTGIDVYFVYAPNDKDNKRFLLMVQAFKNILEAHNARVHIGANLVNN